jgi:flagellar protein FliJ
VNGPSFRFRLERVRAVRERKEKLAQQELARSMSRLTDKRAELQDAEASLERARAEQRTASEAPGAMRGAELQARQAFIERVEASRSSRAQAVRRGEAEVQEQNAKLLVAATEHEMLERLRDRRRSEHDREAARRESNLIDEIAAARAGRSVA